MSPLTALLLKVGIAVAVLVGACAATWFRADAHYSQALASLEGQLKGAAAEQKKAVDAQIKLDADAAKGIDDEAKAQIGSMASTIADLSLRNAAGRSAVRVCPAAISPYLAPAVTLGPAAAAGDRPAPATPEPDIGIARETLTDAVTVGLDALKAELLWRKWAREVEQHP
jgi:hypothetical protein